MADASIIDIGGVQWNIKDKESRERVTVIEDLLTVKDLPNLTISRSAGYSWTSLQLYNHYSFGKIHFVYVRIQNVSGGGIGSTNSAKIGLLNIMPIKETSFMLFDYVSGKNMRCYLDKEGFFYIGESNGVSSGNNVCFGELIFAEA